jgi:14-3-3 protein epsilon
MVDKDDLLNRCKLNDLIENYGEMFEYLKELSTIKIDLQMDELDLITRCTKCYIGHKRGQYRKILTLIDKDKIVDNQKNFSLLEILRKKLSEEILQLCNKTIEISQNFLRNNPTFPKKTQLYFTKTIADHYRYIYEINNKDEIKLKAKDFYEKSLQTIKECKYTSTETPYLTFYLNYSVFLHDTMKNTDEAIKVSKTCLYEALKDTEEIVDNSQKDIVLLCQMLKDNISLWKTEFNEGNNDNNNINNNLVSGTSENDKKNESLNEIRTSNEK